MCRVTGLFFFPGGGGGGEVGGGRISSEIPKGNVMFYIISALTQLWSMQIKVTNAKTCTNDFDWHR